MWKKVISFTLVTMLFVLSGKTAAAAPLAPVVHYVEGLGEIELIPTSEIEISPFVSVQGSKSVTFNSDVRFFTHVTTLTRHQPNSKLQMSHNHNRVVEFRIASGGNASQFSVYPRTTISLNGVIGIGQQGRMDVRPVGVGGGSATISWWMHP